jgi:hypothetical protein
VDEAFSLLRSHARNHGERLTEVARKFLDGAVDPMKSRPQSSGRHT